MTNSIRYYLDWKIFREFVLQGTPVQWMDPLWTTGALPLSVFWPRWVSSSPLQDCRRVVVPSDWRHLKSGLWNVTTYLWNSRQPGSSPLSVVEGFGVIQHGTDSWYVGLSSSEGVQRLYPRRREDENIYEIIFIRLRPKPKYLPNFSPPLLPVSLFLLDSFSNG